MLKQHIDKLSRTLNQESLQTIAEDGSYTANFDGAGEISMRENADSGITLFTTLGPIPSKKSEEFLLKLMEANLLGKETGGAHFGLDREGKNVTFTSFLFDPTNYKEFHDALEDFANYAECWRDDVIQMQNKEMS